MTGRPYDIPTVLAVIARIVESGGVDPTPAIDSPVYKEGIDDNSELGRLVVAQMRREYRNRNIAHTNRQMAEARREINNLDHTTRQQQASLRAHRIKLESHEKAVTWYSHEVFGYECSLEAQRAHKVALEAKISKLEAERQESEDRINRLDEEDSTLMAAYLSSQ